MTLTLTEEQESEFILSSKDRVLRQCRALGAQPEEVQEICNKIKSYQGWCPEFTKYAEKYEKIGDEAEDDKAKVSNYRRAAIYYHMGEQYVLLDNAEKKTTYRRLVAVYLRAAKYFTFPTDFMEIPFANASLPAYFRHIKGVKKAPCVILLRGVDASKDVQLQVVSDSLLKQQIFTLLLDLPGQGEPRFRGMMMVPDYEKPVGAAVDYLLSRSDVDANSIGVWGMSYGGFIAPRAAALEKRIKACISMGGTFSLYESNIERQLTMRFINNSGLSENEWAQRIKEYTLEGVIKNLTRPLLVVNGSNEFVWTLAQTKKIYEEAPGPKDMKIYDGYGHCAFYNNPDEVLSYCAIWMKKQLTKK